MRFVALLVVALASSTAHAVDIKFSIMPTVVAEGDYRVLSNEAEGENGFQLARARLGARAVLFDRFLLVFTGEYVHGETPALLDAFVRVALQHGLYLQLGFFKTPLFASARDDEIFVQPIPERTLVVTSFWPDRDLGLELRWAPLTKPVEIFARLGNGTGSILGNDNRYPAGDVRADLVFGRAHFGAPPELRYGLRVGVGAEVKRVTDRFGTSGTAETGFVYWRPQSLDGLRVVAEAHLHAQAGPVQLRAEAGFAREGRAADTDGNPATPRIDLATIYSWGTSVELAWMITGEHRMPSFWSGDLSTHKYGAFELAIRGERIALGLGASDVKAGGVWSGALAARWWSIWRVGVGLAMYVHRYDTAPLEEPGTLTSIVGLARAVIALP